MDLTNINYKKLRKQKKLLICLASWMDKQGYLKDGELIYGLIHLIDNVQDAAVNDSDLTVSEIFGKKYARKHGL